MFIRKLGNCVEIQHILCKFLGTFPKCPKKDLEAELQPIKCSFVQFCSTNIHTNYTTIARNGIAILAATFFVCFCIKCNKIFSNLHTPQKSLKIPQMLPRLLLFKYFPKMEEYICEVFTFSLRTVEQKKEPFCSPQYLVFIFIKYHKMKKGGPLKFLKGNLRRKKNDRSGAVGCVGRTYRI